MAETPRHEEEGRVGRGGGGAGILTHVTKFPEYKITFRFTLVFFLFFF